MPVKRPAALPRCFSSLWTLLAREDEALGSRRAMAAKLRVSTHTLQRLLVDGTVPDLAVEQSPYVMNSWTRTLARIALGLGRDPAGLIRSTGIVVDGRVRAMIEAEIARVQPDPAPCDAAPSPDLAGLMGVLMGSDGSADPPSIRAAREQVQDALRQFMVASGRAAPGMAGSEDLASGRFCRSCMASLSDPHNKGAADEYCRWCSDDEGRVRSEEEVHRILTSWFMRWQKGISRTQASERARHYMLSMPAWASDQGR